MPFSTRSPRAWLATASVVLAACSGTTDDAADSGASNDAEPSLADAAREAPDAGALDATPLDAGLADAGDLRPITPVFTAIDGTPPSTPRGRWGAPITYVPSERRFILFGGSTYPIEGAVGGTWSYALDDGTWTELSTGAPPPARYCHGLVYLPDTHEVLLVGGRDDSGPLPAAAWTLDLAAGAWSPVAGAVPPGVIGPAAAWMPSPGGGRAVVFGGSSRRGLSTETWAYDPAARSFSQVATSSTPPGRQDGMIAFDPGAPGEGGRLLLSGGSTRLFPTPLHLDDLWSFDGTSWRFVPVAGERPVGRRSMGAAFDEAHREWVMWSGTIESDDLQDLWVLDAARDRWARHPTDGAPEPRGFHAFAFVPEEERFLGFGGLRQPNFRALEDGFELRLRAR